MAPLASAFPGRTVGVGGGLEHFIWLLLLCVLCVCVFSFVEDRLSSHSCIALVSRRCKRSVLLCTGTV